MSDQPASSSSGNSKNGNQNSPSNQPVAFVPEIEVTLPNTMKAVGPEIKVIKGRFGAQCIPRARDFSDLIDIADYGRKAVGQSPDQKKKGPGPGLKINNEGRLKVNLAEGSYLTYNTAGQLGVDTANLFKGMLTMYTGKKRDISRPWSVSEGPDWMLQVLGDGGNETRRMEKLENVESILGKSFMSEDVRKLWETEEYGELIKVLERWKSESPKIEREVAEGKATVEDIVEAGYGGFVGAFVAWSFAMYRQKIEPVTEEERRGIVEEMVEEIRDGRTGNSPYGYWPFRDVLDDVIESLGVLSRWTHFIKYTGQSDAIHD